MTNPEEAMVAKVAASIWEEWGQYEIRVCEEQMPEIARAAIAAIGEHRDGEVGRTVLQKAIETLAASRHLIGKYVPDHHWLPEHDKRIADLKAALSAIEE